MAKFDMNAMLKQAQQMQAQMMEAQEQAKQEIVEASAGGGMVTVKANGGGEIVEIPIDPKAIDPDDPELLADIVMAAANEALRSASRPRRVEDPGPDARPRLARACRAVGEASSLDPLHDRQRRRRAGEAEPRAVAGAAAASPRSPPTTSAGARRAAAGSGAA